MKASFRKILESMSGILQKGPHQVYPEGVFIGQEVNGTKGERKYSSTKGNFVFPLKHYVFIFSDFPVDPCR